MKFATPATLAPTQIMAHAWLAYAIWLYATGHWYAGIAATLMVALMLSPWPAPTSPPEPR